jgi:hypothetical protein
VASGSNLAPVGPRARDAESGPPSGSARDAANVSNLALASSAPVEARSPEAERDASAGDPRLSFEPVPIDPPIEIDDVLDLAEIIEVEPDAIRPRTSLSTPPPASSGSNGEPKPFRISVPADPIPLAAAAPPSLADVALLAAAAAAGSAEAPPPIAVEGRPSHQGQPLASWPPARKAEAPRPRSSAPPALLRHDNGANGRPSAAADAVIADFQVDADSIDAALSPLTVSFAPPPITANAFFELLDKDPTDARESRWLIRVMAAVLAEAGLLEPDRVARAMERLGGPPRPDDT